MLKKRLIEKTGDIFDALETTDKVHVLSDSTSTLEIIKIIYFVLSTSKDKEKYRAIIPDQLNEHYLNPDLSKTKTKGKAFPYIWFFHNEKNGVSSDGILLELDYLFTAIDKDLQRSTNSKDLKTEVKDKYEYKKKEFFSSSMDFVSDGFEKSSSWFLDNDLYESIVEKFFDTTPFLKASLNVAKEIHSRVHHNKNINIHDIKVEKYKRLKENLIALRDRLVSSPPSSKQLFFVVNMTKNTRKLNEFTEHLISLLSKKYSIKLITFNNTSNPINDLNRPDFSRHLIAL